MLLYDRIAARVERKQMWHLKSLFLQRCSAFSDINSHSFYFKKSLLLPCLQATILGARALKNTVNGTHSKKQQKLSCSLTSYFHNPLHLNALCQTGFIHPAVVMYLLISCSPPSDLLNCILFYIVVSEDRQLCSITAFLSWEVYMGGKGGAC